MTPPPVRFLTHPAEFITDAVHAVEPDLDPALVARVIVQITGTRAQQQRLARALHDEPDLLTSGRPTGPPTVADLVTGLREHGARHLMPPRCADCGQPKPLAQRNEQRERICGGCFNRRRNRHATCSNCGHHRWIPFRDRHGRPRCRQCPPERDVDHTAVLCAHIHRHDPDIDLPRLRQLVEQAVPHPFQRRELSWALDQRPDLLTGAGAEGSPRLLTLLDTLLAAGVANLVAPACPFCERTVRLRHVRDGLRCCSRCYEVSRAQICSSCAIRRPVCQRDPAGEPLCGSCARREPSLQQQCSNCGHVRGVHRRVGDLALCVNCSNRTLAVCSVCDQRKNCHFAGTDHPVCSNCRRKQEHREPCSRCGRAHPVATRTADGQPLCGGCGRRIEPCIRCHRPRPVQARLPDGPLCKTCANNDPALHRPCADCGRVDRLHHRRCTTCAYPMLLHDLLAGSPGGQLRPELEPVLAALTASNPQAGLTMLERPSRRRMLAALASTSGPVTHDVLDQLGSPQAVRTLRTILVNAEILPWRDDILTSLEQWIIHTVSEIGDPHERKLVRSFATWHHIRRLRARSSPQQPVEFTQSRYVRRTITSTVELLRWLRERDRSLDTCTQADIDDWLAIDARHLTRGFLAWAVARGHAHDVQISPFETTKTYQTLPEQDQRWTLARRLLHDETIDTSDRVAGLLVILYAQHLSRIARLATEHITQRDSEVHLLIGTKPLVLPNPLADLVLRLALNRRGHAALGHRDDHPWLFPGGSPGRPLSAARLMHRLTALGLRARPGRNTALMDLAAELPAAVLSQLLDISISRATTWAHLAGNIRPGYAAEVARRRSSPPR